MFRTLSSHATIAMAALLTAGLLTVGCGTASEGSRYQAQHGVAPNGYPGGNPIDAGSPALASSTEAKYSRDQEVADAPTGSSSSEHAPAGGK